MTQLPEDIWEEGGSYDGESDDEVGKTHARVFSRPHTVCSIFSLTNLFWLPDFVDGPQDDSDDAAPTADILPKGEFRWGFLRLASQTGRFIVEQTQADAHIKELQLQLFNCASIFSWTQAYDACLARYFSKNFGKPSFAFGSAHVDMMIDTFARIQRALFPTSSVTDLLRQIIEQRFGFKDLPDGLFYFPIRMGGLELRNPLIPLFGVRESPRTSPHRMLERALDKDEENYRIAKEKFQKDGTGAGLGRYSNFELRGSMKAQQGENGSDDFMPMDEFLRYREEKSVNLAWPYSALLEIPEEKEPDKTPQITSWLEGLTREKAVKGRKGGGRGKGMKRKSSHLRDLTNLHLLLAGAAATRTTAKVEPGIHKAWPSMQPDWKCILAVHGAEVVQKYGSVRIVGEARVPVRVVSVMKQRRLRWRG